eukprot:4878641-Amphidinium_carterae.1
MVSSCIAKTPAWDTPTNPKISKSLKKGDFSRKSSRAVATYLAIPKIVSSEPGVNGQHAMAVESNRSPHE